MLYVHMPDLQVCVVEFKVDQKSPNTGNYALAGQLIDRCRTLFNAQPQRRTALAVGMTCLDLLLLRITTDEMQAITVEKTESLSLACVVAGVQMLSVNAQGIHTLAQVLAADIEESQNFRVPQVPVACEVEGRLLHDFKQVRLERGTNAAVHIATWKRTPRTVQPLTNPPDPVDLDDTVIVKVGVKDEEVSCMTMPLAPSAICCLACFEG